jgi:hypothetical protein
LDNSLIERMARLRGIGDAYHDYRGELRYFSLQTKTDLLRAMGCRVDDEAALANELSVLEVSRWRLLLPPIAAAHGSRIGLDVNVPAKDFGSTLVWTVNLEDGSRRDGHLSTADCREVWRGDVAGSWITRRRLELPLDLPPGYHELEVKLGGSTTRCSLVVSPPQCYEPAAVVQGRRLWGIAVQLYTVRSRVNWGIGDFGDLKQLIRWLAPRGAGFIGLNPLHALAPADAQRSSPVQRIEPPFPECSVHLSGRCAGVCPLPGGHLTGERCRNSRIRLNALRSAISWTTSGWPMPSSRFCSCCFAISTTGI